MMNLMRDLISRSFCFTFAQRRRQVFSPGAIRAPNGSDLTCMGFGREFKPFLKQGIKGQLVLDQQRMGAHVMSIFRPPPSRHDVLFQKSRGSQWFPLISTYPRHSMSVIYADHPSNHPWPRPWPFPPVPFPGRVMGVRLPSDRLHGALPRGKCINMQKWAAAPS